MEYEIVEDIVALLIGGEYIDVESAYYVKKMLSCELVEVGKVGYFPFLVLEEFVKIAFK